MYRIKTLNKISNASLNLLDQTRFQVGSDVENEDGILVRSAHCSGLNGFSGLGISAISSAGCKPSKG